MWNHLFKKAFNSGCDYFYQLGDDIVFLRKDYISTYITRLQKNHNIGVTGFRTKNGNTKIITQSFVSRKHMEIFGYYFPPEIINWYCDDWISQVYGKGAGSYFPLGHFLENKNCCTGRSGRYRISRDNEPYNRALKTDRERLRVYLKEHRPKD
jgi:GT2 family glycosyltransferase